MAGGLTQSSSGSGVFFQGDGQSQILVNSHLNASHGNSPNSGRPNMCMISGETNNPVLNNISNSGPSVGASSLVTDANSDFSGGPQLQRNASFNTDYMRLPASPMSFSSNNITISGSSVVDGSTVQQKSSQHDLGVQQQGASSATSVPTPQTNHISFPLGSRIPGSFIQDPYYISQVQKKPRLDMKQEDILQQQVLQQLFQRQDSMQFQGQNPQLQLLLQQQRLRQQQQLLQSMPPMQRVQMQQQQQQQLQLRHQLQQQGMQPQFSGVKRSHETGICTRRLMQYLYHQRQRPHDNSIVYWRKFVAEYFSPRAKKRWCLSLYDNVGQQRLGAIPQAAADAWHCDICGSKSGRGFEATFEVLPKLNEIKFGSGVIDELLYLDLPQECRFASGIMMLEYGKAVQETVYEELRVVREGHLRIKFSQDLKILSWEFCARRHEELLPRRLVAPQVNQLLQVAQKCQSTISESGSDGVSQQDLQENSKMVLTAGRQLAKSLELQFLNDLGFSKRYVRCLQISEVVNSMKDLFDFCGDHKVGPMDAIKSYTRNTNASKLQMQQRMHEIEQLASAQGLPNDRSTINKLLALRSGINIPTNNAANQMVGHGVPSGSGPTPFALANYQNMLMRQNSMPTNPNKTNQSPSSSTLSANQSPRLPPQHQMQPRSLSVSQQQDPNRNQALQQQMIQQMYQEMSDNGQQQSIPGQDRNVVNMGRSSMGFGQNGQNGFPGTPTASNVSGTSGHGRSLSRNNSFNAASNNDTSSAADSKSGFNQSQNLASHEFTGTEFFNSDLDDNLGYTWKT